MTSGWISFGFRIALTVRQYATRSSDWDIRNLCINIIGQRKSSLIVIGLSLLNYIQKFAKCRWHRNKRFKDVEKVADQDNVFTAVWLREQFYVCITEYSFAEIR